jgi:hypothetical protein
VRPLAAPWDARAQPPEGAAEVVASRASPPEEAVGLAEVSRASLPAAVAGPSAWPQEVAAERAEAVGAQHAAEAAGVALPAEVELLEAAAARRAWPQEAVAAEEWRASRAAARPSAAASACRQDRLLPWPARPRSAPPARAMRCLRNASP